MRARLPSAAAHLLMRFGARVPRVAEALAFGAGIHAQTHLRAPCAGSVRGAAACWPVPAPRVPADDGRLPAGPPPACKRGLRAAAWRKMNFPQKFLRYALQRGGFVLQ